MIGLLTKALLAVRIPAVAAQPLAWMILGLFVVLALWLGLASRDGGIIAKHETEIEAAIQRDGRAADTSAVLRAEARRRVEEEARDEFNAATAHLPDAGLTDRQRLDLCRELRQAGTDTGLIPECRNVHPGTEAGARRVDPPAR